MSPALRHPVADKILSRFSDRLRLAYSGGAPLYGAISHCFVGLGLPLLQGYGLTEAAPVAARFAWEIVKLHVGRATELRERKIIR